MGQIINRAAPNLDADEYKTYSVVSPIATHTRSATCQEVECQAHAHGWRSRFDLNTTLGKAQADWVANHSGRHFVVVHNGSASGGNGMIELEFPAGQRCFAEHRVSLERPANFVVRDGDFRGNPFGTAPVIRRPEDWVDDFATHQQRVADAIERG